MIPRASGSLTAIRALFSGKAEWSDAAERVLSSRALVRWGGVALVAGGLVGIFANLLVQWAYLGSSGYNPRIEQRLAALEALHGVGRFLVAVGLLGLYATLTKRSRWLKMLAGAGALLAVLLVVCFGGALLYLALVRPPYYAPWRTLQIFYAGGFLGQPVVLMLLGVAALWTRSLGPWRVLPLSAALFGSPVPYLLLLPLLPPPSRPIPGASTRELVLDAVLSASPAVLTGLCYVLLGLAMLGAKKREAALLLRDRRATEQVNLRKARHLYDKGFGVGDLSAVDEVVGPGALDRRGGHRGPDGFKRIVRDLRRTFPDLRLTVDEQTAAGDTVTTRCSFSGTDRGGLLWYPPTNKYAAFSVTYTDRFAGGRLVEHDGESDTGALLARLGLSGGAG